jgi:predicted metalloprotease
MKWEGERESSNVEDRRAGGPSMGGRMGGARIGGRGIGLGTIAIALVGGWILGVNPLTILGVLSGGGGIEMPGASSPAPSGPAPAPTDSGGRFASVVLASTEDVWTRIFASANAQYQPPKLVLFRGRTPTACGTGEAASGPFYCPADQKVYIDLAFFDVMQQRLGAAGDTAQAYVIAHEVGHHIQNLTGTMDKVQQLRQRLSQAQYNQVSVRLELQADCYAGVWVHHSQQAKQWLEAGDIEEAMNAAAAVGDDRLQGGAARPESFTHGTSAQRVQWFKTGAQTGRLDACDTFKTRG